MKNTLITKISLAITGLLAIPVFVMASAMPAFDVVGISFIEKTSASAVVSFDSRDADFTRFTGGPVVMAEFTNTKTGYAGTTAYANPSQGSTTYTFRIDNLEPATEYAVTAVMNYQGVTYKSHSKLFKTLGTPASSASSTGIATNTGTTSTDTTNSNNAVITLPTIGSLFGGSSSGSSTGQNAVQKKIMTGGVTNKDGVGIAITNEQARVDARDTFTYTVRYQNGRTTSLQNAKIVIELPANYEFVRSTAELDYKTRDNTVHMTIGRIAPGTTKSFTFTARALDGNNGEVSTKASLFYEGGSISAVDRDSFYGGAKSALGASVFGLGFFPQTLFGWIALIILITIVVIVARRYTTAPVVPPVPPLQPGQDPNQKTA